MKYCDECGSLLELKENGIDGYIPYCPKCQSFKFPTFNSAVSAIILSPSKDKILLIQQYNKPSNILVAGYINKGENANEALIREIKEEVNLKVISYQYNDNAYYAKSNTLIHNFIVVVEDENFKLTSEVDKAAWFLKKEVLTAIKPDSLAKKFVEEYLNKSRA